MKLTFHGQVSVSVEQVGAWSPGESKDVPDGLAARLLTRNDFRPTPKPARASKPKSDKDK